MSRTLPIEAALPALRQALAGGSGVVLAAPPGAGKSTLVPLALLDEPWARSGRLLMLEPRRLAARAVATRMAQTLGEPVGGIVGYRMRLDTRVSARTRIEVITEGVLTRMLQADAALEDCAAVIFDEFHERSLQADLGLALTLDARAQLAPELRVLVMSATLETAPVAALLGDGIVIEAAGAPYAVTTRYGGQGLPLLPGSLPAGLPYDAAERQVAALTRRALREEEGDVLVFLPGAREIRRVRELLGGGTIEVAGRSVQVLPLYGELSGREQDEALVERADGARRVVLATNIAETSLTLPGIRIVVDSGLARRAAFDPVTGMSGLVTRRISRASAEQRRGRAGRLGPGICWRAWSEGAQPSLAAHTPPEILEADLSALALELAAWGALEARTLRWLDPPPEAALGAARTLLARLGALDHGGRITAHGRTLARLPLHPRLAHMLVAAAPLGAAQQAAQLAGLLSERDVLRGSQAAADADVRTRLELLSGTAHASQVDAVGLRRARRLAGELERDLARVVGRPGPGAPRPDGEVGPGVLLAFAYPDRIGRRRAGEEGRYTLTNGRGARFGQAQSLARSEFIVAAELDDAEREARILLAAPLARADLEAHFASRLTTCEEVAWNSREQAVLARRIVKLDALVVEEKPLPSIPAEAARAAMLEGLAELGLGALTWSAGARNLRARLAFVRAQVPDAESRWPDVGDAALLEQRAQWLGPWLEGVTRREHLARIPLEDALRALLSWEQARELDELAPVYLQVPSGSRVTLDYLDESAPAASVRLQEVFGLHSTPRVAGGRVPVTFKLLSPAQRPVQVTRDLASFWRGAYAEVRKDLRGRYPRHYWPEDPLQATAIRGSMRRPARE